MEKIYILTVCILLQPLLIYSQSDLFVFGTSGDYERSTDNYQVSWTMGEAITFSKADAGISSMMAGFQQVSDDEGTSFGKEAQNRSFTLYPNPAADVLYIHPSVRTDNRYNFLIYNSSGLLIKEMPIAQKIDVSRLTSGVYTIVITNSEKIEIQKFIITK